MTKSTAKKATSVKKKPVPTKAGKAPGSSVLEIPESLLKKPAKPRSKKKTERELELRASLWPEITSDDIWDRHKNDGYTTIPRTMPHIMAIIDALTKGKPASPAYFALWCRVFDSGYIRIQAQEAFASESGFSGERKLTVWKGRMRSLSELGFIRSAEGDCGEFEHVLLPNPHHVIQRIIAESPSLIPNQLIRSIATRAIDIGASDCKIEA